MTDAEAILEICKAIGSEAEPLALVHRGRRVLLALPAGRGAAMRTLRLYQPQRRIARAFVGSLRLAVGAGIHRRFLATLRTPVERSALEPGFPKTAAGTLGIMLGSPEHRIRRAIACFKTESGWEVAKAAFGVEGQDVVRSEVGVLRDLASGVRGIPAVLGVHEAPGLTLMRMPYINGRVVMPGEVDGALALLRGWISNAPVRPITGFSEWPAIARALEGHPKGRVALSELSQFRLVPSIRHGDFARWNLLQTGSGELMVIDWEWGVASGMPGLDLVHFFAQDARLVERLPPPELIRTVAQALRRADCQDYLVAAGWQGDVRAVMLASIAFTVGAAQQANEEVLAALLAAW